MGNSFFENAKICHRCPTRGQSYVCPLSGKPLGEHAESGECPELRFPSRGIGDTIAKVLHATGIGPVAKRVIEATTGEPCGCDDRQAALNELVPFKKPEE